MSDPVYQWLLGATKTHCPTCHRLAGQRHTASEWLSLHVPGFHAGCQCQLMLVNSLTQPYLDQYAPAGVTGDWLGDVLLKTFSALVLPLLPTVPLFTLDRRKDSAAAKKKFQHASREREERPTFRLRPNLRRPAAPALPRIPRPGRSTHRGEDEEQTSPDWY
jgi:hypothetical protein